MAARSLVVCFINRSHDRCQLALAAPRCFCIAPLRIGLHAQCAVLYCSRRFPELCLTLGPQMLGWRYIFNEGVLSALSDLPPRGGSVDQNVFQIEIFI
jgi:hypothetical protein